MTVTRAGMPEWLDQVITCTHDRSEEVADLAARHLTPDTPSYDALMRASCKFDSAVAEIRRALLAMPKQGAA